MTRTVWTIAVFGAFTASAYAQEELVGRWQHTEAAPVRFVLEFAADGAFRMVLPAPIVFADDAALDLEGGFSLAAFAEGAEFFLMGTWAASSGQLGLHIDQVSFSADGLSLEAFWVEAGKALAAHNAETEKVAEKDYAAYEQNMVTYLFAVYPPDGLQEELGGMFSSVDYLYMVVDDVLSLTDESEVSVWGRTGSTAAPSASWGQAKARAR